MDKVGSNPVTSAEVQDFHDCVESCGLSEVIRLAVNLHRMTNMVPIVFA